MRPTLTAALVWILMAAGMAFAQPRRPMPRPGARLGALIERLNRMTPQERQRALERLPADRRAHIEERLERLNAMPPRARQRLGRQYEAFQKLPPEKQETFRKAFRELNQLPEDRRPLVRREVVRLRNLPAERRASRMESESFQSQYNESERQLIRDLAEFIPPSPEGER